MKYFINQPGCLGDILFTLNFAEQLSKEADVYWKVAPTFWESGIKRVISPAKIGPNVFQPSDTNKLFTLCDMVDRSNPELMRVKYTRYGLDWKDWASSVKFERNHETEDDLRKHLGI